MNWLDSCPASTNAWPNWKQAGWRWADGTTDGKAVGRQRTTAEPFRPIALAPNSRWTTVVAPGRYGGCRDHLHNRWSASLAMSTEGSSPSRPRQFWMGIGECFGGRQLA